MTQMHWVGRAWRQPLGRRALVASSACASCALMCFYCVSLTHSMLLMLSSWISVFALCSLLSTVFSECAPRKATSVFSYGLARVPVLAVFATTMLAQLFSIFLSKESFEHLLAPHHGSGKGAGAEDAAHHDQHEEETSSSWPYIIAALSSSAALTLSAYSVKSGPFQHVLTAATSSSLQEHAADLSHALCWAVPGLSRVLLPRINAMSLLAATTTLLILLCEHFRHEFHWADPVSCLLLSCAVFSTMWPLSLYTGRILLQTCPPHLLNQLDRCISEASTIEGVLELRAGHFWQLDFSSLVGTVDVRVRRDADEQLVLASVTDKLSSVVSKLTVQIVKDAAWQQQPIADYSSHNGYTPSTNYYGGYDEHVHHGHSHSPGGHHH